MDKFCDVELVFSGKVFRSHRIKLWQDSVYFRNLFDENDECKTIDFANIENIDSQMIENYLKLLNNVSGLDYIKLFDANKYIESKAIKKLFRYTKNFSNETKSIIFNHICNNIDNINDYFNLYMTLLKTINLKDSFDLLSEKSILTLIYYFIDDENNVKYGYGKWEDYITGLFDILIAKKYDKKIINVVFISYCSMSYNGLKEDIIRTDEMKKMILDNIDFRYIINMSSCDGMFLNHIKTKINTIRETSYPNSVKKTGPKGKPPQ